MLKFQLSENTEQTHAKAHLFFIIPQNLLICKKKIEINNIFTTLHGYFNIVLSEISIGSYYLYFFLTQKVKKSYY